MVVLWRPGHAWPLLLAANRDERLDRAWDPPGAWWPERPGLVGGRDRLGGGSWMAIEDGRVACVLNRPGSLGPAPGKRSRGELPALALAGAPIAAGLYRPFNLVIAGRDGARFVRGDGVELAQWALPAGLSMITAYDPDDRASGRVRAHREAFLTEPSPPDWEPWRAALSDATGPDPVFVPPRDGFGTVCSSVVAWPAVGAPAWHFRSGLGAWSVPCLESPAEGAYAGAKPGGVSCDTMDGSGAHTPPHCTSGHPPGPLL